MNPLRLRWRMRLKKIVEKESSNETHTGIEKLNSGILNSSRRRK